MMTDLDILFLRIWRKPTNFLCALTGKDNFFFARASMVLAGACLLLEFVFDKPEYRVWDGIFGVIFVLWLLPQRRRVIKDLQNFVESGGRALPLSVYFDRVSRVMWMCFAFLFAILISNLSDVANELFYIFWSGSAYFALNFNAGGKSAVRRAAEKVLALARSIKLPNPLPKPSPNPA